jgi:Tc5 transposase DNA-binding domain
MTKRKPSSHNGNLSAIQKAKIVKHKQANSTISNDELAEWAQNEFHLTRKPSESTMSRTWGKRMQYLDIRPQDHHIRRQRVVTHATVEEALVTWVLQNQHQKLSISREAIREKGKRFANALGIGDALKFSDNWLTLFCQRNGFR